VGGPTAGLAALAEGHLHGDDADQQVDRAPGAPDLSGHLF
jgi:hypothetical protein